MAYIDYTSNDSTISLDKYIKEKIRMLKKDFMIKLTPEQIAHIRELKNEIQVDNYAHDLIFNR